MANRDNPHGLTPLGRTNGGGPFQVQYFQKDASEAAAIFIGDAVNREDDGFIEANSATPGTTFYSGVSLNYGAAATLTGHLVVISPGALYEAQDNNASAGIVFADLGLNANLQLNAGSATTKISGHEINETPKDVTASLDVHLVKKYDVPDNAYGPWCRVEIYFNTHRMASASVGV